MPVVLVLWDNLKRRFYYKCNIQCNIKSSSNKRIVPCYNSISEEPTGLETLDIESGLTVWDVFFIFEDLFIWLLFICILNYFPPANIMLVLKNSFSQNKTLSIFIGQTRVTGLKICL